MLMDSLPDDSLVVSVGGQIKYMSGRKHSLKFRTHAMMLNDASLQKYCACRLNNPSHITHVLTVINFARPQTSGTSQDSKSRTLR